MDSVKPYCGFPLFVTWTIELVEPTIVRIRGDNKTISPELFPLVQANPTPTSGFSPIFVNCLYNRMLGYFSFNYVLIVLFC